MIELTKSPVRFNAENHTYWLGPIQLQGVTSTLISRAFPDKYKGIDPDVLANAARKGSELHTAIEFHDKFGGADGDDQRVANYELMKHQMGLRTVCNEYLVSDTLHYASKIDIVMADGNDAISLVDIKTTYNLDRASAGLQLSIYKRLFERQNPALKVSHIYVLWLPNKDTSVCEMYELSVVADETIDALIEADINDEPYTYQLIPDEWQELEQQYRLWSARQEECEANVKAVKERMMEVMRTSNLKSVKTDAYAVSYIPAKVARRFDSAAFKKANADLYDSYTKEVEVAEQIRLLPKKFA